MSAQGRIRTAVLRIEASFQARLWGPAIGPCRTRRKTSAGSPRAPIAGCVVVRFLFAVGHGGMGGVRYAEALAA